MSSDNHHWVPQLLIRNFVDTDGRVFRLEIKTDKVTKPPPKHAASAPGFNDFEVNGEVISYEDRLEKIETAAAPVFKSILNTQSTSDLSDRERKSVADFIAAQSFRTQAFHEGMGTGIPRKDFGPTFAQLWRSAFILASEIKRRPWVPMVIQHDDVFYLGDNPVVLQHTERPESQESMGFDVKGVEAFLPLSPKVALYMPCTSVSKEIIDGYETAVAAPGTVRLAGPNGDAAVQDQFLAVAERVRHNSGPLYQALTTGCSITAVPPNVENLNYLQCAFAHEAVYSNRKDFTFAKLVFKKTPAYRGDVKVSLAMLSPDAPPTSDDS